MKDSHIEWTDHTFNPWWGCEKVSPACDHCYAWTMDKRFKPNGKRHWGANAPRRFFGEKHWAEPLTWNRAAKKAGTRARVFCGSMCDVMEKHRDFQTDLGMDLSRVRLCALIARTPRLTWMLLTKRPENYREMLPPSWLKEAPGNVWLGTSVEDQKTADERIPLLLQTPAAVRFVSAEPLLGPVNLGLLGTIPNSSPYSLTADRLDWIVTGGESGPNARPSHPDWFRQIRDDCQAARVAYFFKQWGAWVPTTQNQWVTGHEHRIFPDGDYMDWANFELGPWGDEDAEEIVRVGKKAAGRELDGRTWDKFPEVSR
jgi:protein gp37